MPVIVRTLDPRAVGRVHTQLLNEKGMTFTCGAVFLSAWKPKVVGVSLGRGVVGVGAPEKGLLCS